MATPPGTHGILNSNQLFLFPSQPLTTMAERVRLHRSLRAKNCLGYIYIYIFRPQEKITGRRETGLSRSTIGDL